MCKSDACDRKGCNVKNLIIDKQRYYCKGCNRTFTDEEVALLLKSGK